METRRCQRNSLAEGTNKSSRVTGSMILAAKIHGTSLCSVVEVTRPQLQVSGFLLFSLLTNLFFLSHLNSWEMYQIGLANFHHSQFDTAFHYVLWCELVVFIFGGRRWSVLSQLRCGGSYKIENFLLGPTWFSMDCVWSTFSQKGLAGAVLAWGLGKMSRPWLIEGLPLGGDWNSEWMSM
jgi:hypothetical protein